MTDIIPLKMSPYGSAMEINAGAFPSAEDRWREYKSVGLRVKSRSAH
jgi:hypothetical protein